jgi:multiple sugar transport system permease protein
MFRDTISGRRLRKNILIVIASTLVLIFVLAPIYWIINSSFQRDISLEDNPPHLVPTGGSFTLDAYDFVLTGRTHPGSSAMLQSTYTVSGTLVMPAIANSLIIALFVTLINVLFGFPAGHVFARYRFLGDKKVFLTLMATRLLPSISLVIPMYILLKALGLLDTKTALVAIYSGITLPFTTWIMRAYFANIPVEYEEAARLDGCGYLRSLVKVVIPLARPGIIAAAIFAFMTSYGEFVFATILTQTMNAKTQTVVLAVIAGGISKSHDMAAAATVLSFLPPILLAVIFRKQVLDGLTARLGLS